MLGLSSKRPREPDELEGRNGNTARGSKKPRPLVLHTPPDAFRKLSPIEARQTFTPLGLPTLTPAESSDDDDGDDTGILCNHFRKAASGSRHLPQTLKSAAPLCNAAMDIDSGRDVQHRTGDDTPHIWPGSANNIGSVQPSPIPRSLINRFLNISDQCTISPTSVNGHTRTPSAAMMDQTSLEVTNQQDHTEEPVTKRDYSSSWPNQRLPSPISEDESMMSCSKSSISDAEMAIGASRSTSPALCTSQNDQGLQCSSDSQQGRYQHDPSSNSVLEENVPLAPHINTPSSKKKFTLSMGFRADCDKCLRKVPGHYSHIIRT